MSEELVVGKDILSYCGKCKLALGHTIVSLESPSVVAKCKCNTCGANHKYRDPATATKKKKRSTKKASEPLLNWADAVQNAANDKKPYTIKTKFSLGDVIDHPSFGLGVVHKIVDNKKIQVLFEKSDKTLVHGV